MINIQDKPIRIAQIIGKWVGGGVESVIMNYYRNIDRNKIQFDFIIDEDSTIDPPIKEIEEMGGQVIFCPPYQKTIKYEKFLIDLFKKNKYKIIHSNINALSIFPLKAAMKAGVKIRIAHSHSTSNRKEWKKTLLKSFLKLFSKKYANVLCACSEFAGKWLFGTNTLKKGKVIIINNGIDIKLYKFNKNIRNDIRNSIGLSENDKVIGHIGRFVKQKNHDFIIEIFKKLYEKDNNYKLMLIGTGPLMKNIKEKVNLLGLSKAVYFLGQKEDANRYYNAMDLFLFPSLYEGLGMSLIEAQVNKLRCIASSEVPQKASISNGISFLKLNLSQEEWIKEIEISLNRKDIKLNDKIRDYDIEIQAKKLNYYYNKWMEEICKK